MPSKCNFVEMLCLCLGLGRLSSSFVVDCRTSWKTEMKNANVMGSTSFEENDFTTVRGPTAAVAFGRTKYVRTLLHCRPVHFEHHFYSRHT